ncbi:hypothetical protein OQZ33_02870 [Pedobacter sp. MC2016-05]|uniref:beta-1,6-N-acetylglucosaminyltransferase n=1 Tax=Pedobacter sp. MC2016-05 TaxID=2994474 RepID=UPI002248155D|nr:beta-1,6-N-acetylglucosaminyltransferase [Pedobacter sp. MC2016-05]MCX2473268.1 hypothetical protein [Pedobacter sp. MC2016-05]
MEKAYLIMAHKSPGQLYRLIDRLNDNQSYFFIHIYIHSDLGQFGILKRFGERVIFLERFDSTWGKLGLTLPLLSGLQTIKDFGLKFDRIILLSGQDYPIKSNIEINNFFKTSPYSVFINHIPLPNIEKWPGRDRGGLYRVDKYYFGGEKTQLLCSRALNMLANFLPFLRRKIPNQMKPYIGQTWIILDMYALNYIIDFNQKNPEYLKFHRHTFVADELVVPMIIGNSNDTELIKRIKNTELRFTIWDTPQDAHPKVLRKSDFERIKFSEEIFARKFDEAIDSEILDMIDKELLHKH